MDHRTWAHNRPGAKPPGRSRALRLIPQPYVASPAVISSNWEDAAACQGIDTETFFPEKGGSTREAREICNGCDVQLACREAALNRREQWGIWGGLDLEERRLIWAGGAA